MQILLCPHMNHSHFASVLGPSNSSSHICFTPLRLRLACVDTSLPLSDFYMRRGQHGRVKLRIRASPDSPLTSSSLGSCSRLVDSDGEVTEVRRMANCAPTDVDSESAHGSNTLSGCVALVKVQRTTLLLWRPLLQRVVRVRISVMHRLVKAFRRRGWKVNKIWKPMSDS